MLYEIVNDRLEIGGRSAAFRAANSFGGRFHPTLIICHDTADRPVPKDTVNYFASKECQVSAHFVVERDGTITQMVPCDHKAWHAGKSVWEGQQGVNNFAIGIEIDNPGALSKDGKAWFTGKNEAGITGIQHAATKEHGDAWWLPYTPEQIEAVTELCMALTAAYPTIKAIGTHWIISPGRKIDTNPTFPLEELRAAVFKKAPAPTGRPPVYPDLKLGDTGDKVQAAQTRLSELGYPIGACDGQFGPQMRVAVLAFEAENNMQYDGALASNEHRALMTDPSVKSMPLGARSEATASDLKDKGSSIIKYATWGVRAIRSAAVGGVAVGGDQALNGGAGLASVNSSVNSVLDSVDQVHATTDHLTSSAVWALTGKGLLIVGVLLLGFLLERLFVWIIKSRVKDHQAGANLAR